MRNGEMVRQQRGFFFRTLHVVWRGDWLSSPCVHHRVRLSRWSLFIVHYHLSVKHITTIATTNKHCESVPWFFQKCPFFHFHVCSNCFLASGSRCDLKIIAVIDVGISEKRNRTSTIVTSQVRWWFRKSTRNESQMYWSQPKLSSAHHLIPMIRNGEKWKREFTTKLSMNLMTTFYLTTLVLKSFEFAPNKAINMKGTTIKRMIRPVWLWEICIFLLAVANTQWNLIHVMPSSSAVHQNGVTSVSSTVEEISHVSCPQCSQSGSSRSGRNSTSHSSNITATNSTTAATNGSSNHRRRERR